MKQCTVVYPVFTVSAGLRGSAYKHGHAYVLLVQKIRIYYIYRLTPMCGRRVRYTRSLSVHFYRRMRVNVTYFLRLYLFFILLNYSLADSKVKLSVLRRTKLNSSVFIIKKKKEFLICLP